MKKIGFLILLLALAALGLTIPVHAQSTDWVSLQSDAAVITAPGQTFTVSVNGTVQTPINGIGVILRYDPACVKVTGRQAGALFASQPVREFLGSDSGGKLDLTYYLEGQSASVAGEGTFLQVTFETLAVCEAKIALDKDTLILGVRQANGLTRALPGVDIRENAVQLSASAETQPESPAAKNPENNTDSAAPASSPGSQILLLAGVGLPLLAAVGVLLFAVLKKPAANNPAATRPPFSAMPVNAPRLMVQNGTGQARSILLTTRRTLIGRHTNCQIQIDGRGISHQHAEISARDGVFYLADLKSHTGTYLNGKLLENGYYPLRDGAEIKLGSEVTCHFTESTARTG
jgi:hypothetical protein